MTASPSKSARSVPAFSADGQRLRNYSIEAAERCASLKLCVPKRTRTGRISSITFRPLPGGSPLRKTAHLGQRYSFREHLEGGLLTWSFVRLFVPRVAWEEREEMELRLIAIFRAVPLSCMTPCPAPAKASGSASSAPGAALGIAAANARGDRGRIRVTQTKAA
jgi:hypothetical protein